LPPSQADRETQHQDSLYRDWRRAQMVMCIVVGNIRIRNMFYHTNFGGEGYDHFRKWPPRMTPRSHPGQLHMVSALDVTWRVCDADVSPGKVATLATQNINISSLLRNSRHAEFQVETYRSVEWLLRCAYKKLMKSQSQPQRLLPASPNSLWLWRQVRPCVAVRLVLSTVEDTVRMAASRSRDHHWCLALDRSLVLALAVAMHN
jgi:hypothetical protein